MIPTMTKLIDILPEGTFNGFLKSMPAGAPWSEDSPDLDSLDALYIYQHSGQKYVQPLMNMFVTDGKLTQAGITACSKMAAALWYPKWTRLWEVATAEFNPIENYSMHEEEDTAPSGTETTELEFSGSETDTLSKAGTETHTRAEAGSEGRTLSHTGSDTVRTLGTAANNKEENSVYGFNSSNPVPASETKVNTDNTVTTTPGVTDTETKNFTNRQTTDTDSFTNRQDTDTKTFTNRKNTETKSFEDRNTHRELDRAGNIGTLTSQQMLQSSLELWQWNFWLQVFEDLDSTICLDCY